MTTNTCARHIPLCDMSELARLAVEIALQPGGLGVLGEMISGTGGPPAGLPLGEAHDIGQIGHLMSYLTNPNQT